LNNLPVLEILHKDNNIQRFVMMLILFSIFFSIFVWVFFSLLIFIFFYHCRLDLVCTDQKITMKGIQSLIVLVFCLHLSYGFYLFQAHHLKECQRYLTCGNDSLILNADTLIPASDKNTYLSEKVYIKPPSTTLGYNISDLLQLIRTHSVISFIPTTKDCAETLFPVKREPTNRTNKFQICGKKESNTKWIFLNVPVNTPNYDEWQKLCNIDIGCFWNISLDEIQAPCYNSDKNTCVWPSELFKQTANQPSVKIPPKANLILALTIFATIFFMVCAILLIVLVRMQRTAGLPVV